MKINLIVRLVLTVIGLGWAYYGWYKYIFFSIFGKSGEGVFSGFLSFLFKIRLG